MKFNYFSKGTRVRFTGKGGLGIETGEIGTVVCGDTWGNIAVRWDKENKYRHDCSGLTDRRHGWWTLPKDMEIIKEE